MFSSINRQHGQTAALARGLDAAGKARVVRLSDGEVEESEVDALAWVELDEPGSVRRPAPRVGRGEAGQVAALTRHDDGFEGLAEGPLRGDDWEQEEHA